MGLRAFVIRRLLLLIPTLLGATLLIFAVSQLFSATARAALYITNPQMMSAQNIQSVIDKYRLNDPAYLQFFSWLREVLNGNLGWSPTARSPVTEALLTRFPATAEIVTIVAPLVIFIGIYLGVKSAVHRDKPVDHITRSTSIIGMSLPSFWLGIILISIFGVNLGWLPTGSRLSVQASNFVNTSTSFIKYTGLMWVDGILNGQLWITADAIQHIILPVIVLVTIQTAAIVRIMRSSMLEALNKGYITAARAKGLSQNEVINKHARRNALIPTVTLSGMMVAGMLNGLVITETVFGFGGLGQWSAQSALRLDIAGVLGFTLFSGFIFVVANLFVDILYAYLDPRIRLG
jgi:peptide/nickel transport system permease protein